MKLLEQTNNEMIKNWILKTKQIKKGEKGFLNHTNYLSCKQRPSHQYTDITILNDGAANILKEIECRQVYRRKNGLRGGGVRNYATSFVMSLPRDIKQPNKEQWRKIGLYAVKQISETNNIDFQQLKKLSHIVLHNESDSPDKPSHLHILISNVVDNHVVKGISQKRSTYIAKQSFNYSVKRLLNEDNNLYQSINKRTGNKPLFVARSEKALSIMQRFKSFKDVINLWFDAIIEKKNKSIIANLAKKAAKALDHFDSSIDQPNNQITDKILSAVEELETIDINDNLTELPNNNLKNDYKVTSKTARRRLKLKPS